VISLLLSSSDLKLNEKIGNFSVYAIAKEQGVRMRSFFGYVLWAVCVLVPLFLILTLLPISPILKLY
jgi:Putative citrate transport